MYNFQYFYRSIHTYISVFLMADSEDLSCFFLSLSILFIFRLEINTNVFTNAFALISIYLLNTSRNK